MPYSDVGDPTTGEFQVPRHLDSEIDGFIQRGDIYFLRRFLVAEPDDFVALRLAQYIAEYIKNKLLENVTSEG